MGVRSKSTERALSQSLSVGSDLELESPEDLKSKQPKQESAVGGNVKSQCTEKITRTISQYFGECRPKCEIGHRQGGSKAVERGSSHSENLQNIRRDRVEGIVSFGTFGGW